MSDTGPSRPRAFRLSRPGAQPDQPAEPAPVEIVDQPDVFAEAPPGEDVVLSRTLAQKGIRWSRLFVAGLSGLLTLILSVAAWQLVDDLLRLNPLLAALATGFLALIGLSALVIMVREYVSWRTLRDIDAMRVEAARILASDDRDSARRLVRSLLGGLAADPGTAAARAEVEVYLTEIIDGRDLLALAERRLFAEADRKAVQAISFAAQRVSIVTAVSPRALIDLLFVLAQSTMLVRRIGQVYGGRPGFIRSLALGRRILGHLAITGGVAIGDSLVSQALGQGLAARLSAKLGEGVLNGFLTARVGLAAIAVSRPLPFIDLPEPRLQDVAGSLFPRGQDGEKTAG